jgi:P4 family phage/plasmid primase-like protien
MSERSSLAPPSPSAAAPFDSPPPFALSADPAEPRRDDAILDGKEASQSPVSAPSGESGFYSSGGAAFPGDDAPYLPNPWPSEAQQHEPLQPARLLQALWRSPDLVHQLAFRDASGAAFTSIAVADVAGACDEARRLDAEQCEVYFACAEFNSSASRKADNVAGLFAFWVDVDCGVQKAASGKGYVDLASAMAALRAFCREVGIPLPTHIVSSGAGLHAYWVLDRSLAPAVWRGHASQLKRLMAARTFLADPARTADMASILRFPGTSNRKEAVARPVTLITAEQQFISADKFIDRVAEALAHADVLALPQVAAQRDGHDAAPRALDLTRIASALACIDPDSDDDTWKLKVIAPLAREAARRPEHADALKALAKQHSNGGLRGAPSTKWSSPGSNGKTGENVFDAEWDRFIRDDYAGQPTTLGTLFHLAKQAGWSWPVEDFEIVNQTAVVDPMSAIQLELDSVLARVREGDIGAPLEEPAIDAMVALKDNSTADFHRYRQKLKQANNKVSLGAIDEVVNERRDDSTPAETHHGYARDLLKSLTVNGHMPVAHAGALYVLDVNSKLWVSKGQDLLARHVAERSDGLENCKRRADYQAIAMHAMTMATSPGFFDDAPTGVASPGGFNFLAGDKIRTEPLTPEHRQRHQLDFSPEDLPTPLFSQFLRETFQSVDPDEEAEQVRLAQEIAGAIMFGVMARFQKAVLLQDPYGRAGKGTFVEVIQQLVAPSHITAISPFSWGKEYYVAGLSESQLNVVGELPDGEPIPAAVFKSVIGGDSITGRNPAGRPFAFKNEAGHVFMSNHLINTRDHSEAFFARWLLLEFPNSRIKLGLPVDADLASRIIDNEMPGIAFWAIEGARRVLRQKRFSQSRVHDRLMAKWRRSTSSVEEFIDDECVVTTRPETYVKRSEFYTRYKQWCGENGRKPYSKAHVKELLEYNMTLGVTLASLDGYEIFRGLVLRPSGTHSLVSF